jgi:hypothetical protein
MLMPQALSTMIMAQMAFKYMNDLICILGVGVKNYGK